MLFKGERPITILHRKIDGEQRCSCGATLTLLDGEWIHPEVNDMTEERDTNIKSVWIVRIAKTSDDCPFKDDSSDKCHHTGNRSGICNKDDCRIRAKS